MKVLVTILAVTIAATIAEVAIYLSVVGGLVGLLSIFIVVNKLNEFDKIAEKQTKAVTELDTRVNRIEGKIHRDEV